MIELTWVGEALRWAGWVYWLLAIGALALAITKIKPMAGKVISVAAIVALFGYLPITAALESKKAADARKAAWAHFEMRCKSAGEKIYKTVDGVEGIMLLKVRPKRLNRSDQFELDDPYGSDFRGDGYIESFLWGRNSKGIVSSKTTQGAFRFVDVIDPEDGRWYRYTGHSDEVWKNNSNDQRHVTEFKLERRQVINDSAPRYGVTYDDISTREDREIWVAGSSLKVIDLLTKEVIAERVGYMIDVGQGNTSGGRSPWFYAKNYACPSFTKNSSGHVMLDAYTRKFVEKVLKPIKGE